MALYNTSSVHQDVCMEVYTKMGELWFQLLLSANTELKQVKTKLSEKQDELRQIHNQVEIKETKLECVAQSVTEMEVSN